MEFLKKYLDLSGKLASYSGKAVAWTAGLLVLVVSYDVITRYFLKNSSVAVQELEWHLFAIMFLLGAAYTLRDDGHVRVDLFYSRFSPKTQAIINLTGTLLFLIPFSIMVIYTSYGFVMNSFAIGEKSPDPGGLPARYILKAVIPVSFILLLIEAFAIVSKSILILANKSEN